MLECVEVVQKINERLGFILSKNKTCTQRCIPVSGKKVAERETGAF